jgi:undecaprenyl-phosphate galactose phosphotransferase
MSQITKQRPPQRLSDLIDISASGLLRTGVGGGSRLGIEAAPRLARAIKLGVDILVAVLALLFLSPLLLAIAVFVKADGGPVFYAQTRVGRDGRHFRCWKFRTMAVGAEQRLQQLLAADPAAAEEWARTQKLTADPRVTGIGAVLRRTSLDELPQLLNVLHGDMSLVGPRPIVDAEVERYAEAIASYCAVRPGLTGLWQVSGRSETSYARRVQLDIRYVKTWSLLQDLSILLRTIPAVLLRRGAV